MPVAQKLTIVIVSAFYSEGMGYSENCLSRALARLGHDVHVVTSVYNVYGNEPLYEGTYRDFLGPPQVVPTTREVDGYTLHRLPTSLMSGYIKIKGLSREVAKIKPDVVHSLEIGSLQTWELAVLKPAVGFKLFTESHQNMSVVRPYMRNPHGQWLKRAAYRLTRTVPTWLASHAVETCYAVSPDCREVAQRFFGVPVGKIKLLSLGADTETFHPVVTREDQMSRDALRAELGFQPDDIVCVYTGRFTDDKNPLVLAQAIDSMSQTNAHYKGLFIGNGTQRDAIVGCRNVVVVPFMTHQRLAEHYRASDIGVWPRQESMSMIDAAASGIPLIVSDQIGEPERVAGNGRTYKENDKQSLVEVLTDFADPVARQASGAIGRQRMLAGFNWSGFARTVEDDFRAALSR
jgi:glycosyltransferase involved in cell wall biosynthesis